MKRFRAFQSRQPSLRSTPADGVATRRDERHREAARAFESCDAALGVRSRTSRPIPVASPRATNGG